jgi:peptide/nickel transport system permease protein/oligopeptide transport system permease protein
VQAEEHQAQPAVLTAPSDWVLPKRPSIASNIWKFIRRKPLGAFGVFLVLMMLAMTLGTPKAEFGAPALPSRPLGFELGAPWLARYDAEAIFRDTETGRIAQYFNPSADHWLGTDKGGRDTYSRMVFAARRSLFIGLWALSFAVIIGTTVGIVSAYFRGWLDTLVQRVMDSFQAFPALLILILLVSLFNPDLTILAFGLGFVGVTSVQRIVRGVVLSTREQPYIEAARVIGATDTRTMVFHILPNIMAPIIIVFSIGLGAVILAEAAISFIAPQRVPQDPSWGIMLNVTRSFLPPDPEGYHTLAAGGAIVFSVLGFNLAGDALRDVLDPRLRVG